MGEQEEKQVWTGPCVGGPWNSQEGQSRCPLGFWLIDKPNNKFWVYTWMQKNSNFVVVSATPQKLDDDLLERLRDQWQYDIRVI